MFLKTYGQAGLVSSTKTGYRLPPPYVDVTHTTPVSLLGCSSGGHNDSVLARGHLFFAGCRSLLVLQATQNSERLI